MGKYTDRAREIREAMDAAGKTLTDEQAIAAMTLYRPWQPTAYATGDACRYADQLYRCVQAHTALSDWTPDVTSALWARISVEDWPAWVQPLPAEAYALGARVRHGGARWTSTVDNNVWEPGVYGWAHHD